MPSASHFDVVSGSSVPWQARKCLRTATSTATKIGLNWHPALPQPRHADRYHAVKRIPARPRCQRLVLPGDTSRGGRHLRPRHERQFASPGSCGAVRLRFRALRLRGGCWRRAGTFLATLLAQRPGLCGLLFDQPWVVSGASTIVEAASVADRCRLFSGSFFDEVPAGGDTYVLKSILHDWDDAEATAILRSCGRAMG